MSVNVAKSAITGIALPVFPDPTDINLPFVPAGTGSGTVPYDGSETPFQYSFIMKVGTAAGVPTGTITVMDNSSECPAGNLRNGNRRGNLRSGRIRDPGRILGRGMSRPRPALEC